MNKKFLLIIPIILASILLVLPYVTYSGSYTMTVATDSMAPTLKPGDFLVIQKIPIDQVNEGDIIAFDTHEEGVGVIAHRAIEIASDSNGKIGIDTQGDHNDHPDLWTIYDENLIGIVSEVNPPGKFLQSDYFRYPVIAILVISAALLIRESMPKKGLEVEELHCLRCGNRWFPRIIDGKAKIPSTCPNEKCRSPYWQTPRKSNK